MQGQAISCQTIQTVRIKKPPLAYTNGGFQFQREVTKVTGNLPVFAHDCAGLDWQLHRSKAQGLTGDRL